MAETLKVIALISGGKDSFFSVLHCIQAGHHVVALGNLYPGPGGPPNTAAGHVTEIEHDHEHDLDSFMYQTVGHTVIPLYEQALGIPLYRQQIVGRAVQTGTSYAFPHPHPHEAESWASEEEGRDETESLVPLLKKILSAHPTANALSTGAILSTYQRTRVESVALRLGLTPLSYLWQYPTLTPGAPTSLLEDMHSVALDARIVKVASGGLDESFLWQNVASPHVRGRIERAMKRFGTDGDGAVLGEGGEFETLVVDGPASLFKGRIEVLEKDRKIIRAGGGSAWLKILEARVVMKDFEEPGAIECRVPDMLEPRFKMMMASLGKDGINNNCSPNSRSVRTESKTSQQSPTLLSQQARDSHLLRWTVTAARADSAEFRPDLAIKAIGEIRERLQLASLEPTSIISTVIILRSMQDFASINKAYGSLFAEPNPPSRVTISCGSLLPDDISLVIHLTLQRPSTLPAQSRQALHVQSRSYWAPANIGPYSQAISIPVPSAPMSAETSTVSIAGQIPLIPHTMALPPCSPTADSEHAGFQLQAILALQHLVRVANATHVAWFTHCVAFLPSSPASTISAQARLLGHAWRLLHAPEDAEGDEDEEAERDLWEEKHHGGLEVRGMGAGKAARSVPDWEALGGVGGTADAWPLFWSAEVEELPRGAGVEWAAGLGVTRGPVTLFATGDEQGWRVYQCAFGITLVSVVMIDHSELASAFRDRLGKALHTLGTGPRAERASVAAYVDVSLRGAREEGGFGGCVPCRSIWDADGKRLAAVILFDSL